ncbi:hypothetical protein PIROE2DRAFT_64865 [Piromyces sp. E2]|nr:hypothetical protein PIROE2DRAFT_64865 [Piromyces sp. E2]|eukprot:OUM57677.1 hypothetical protein PIROE2DRAFT_64865 [Piromyces sp. E2]
MNMERSNFKKLCTILGCGLLVFWAGVNCFGYPGVMSVYWKDEFHVGDGETGLVVTFIIVALAFSMFVGGHIHLKWGLTCCIISGLVIVCIGYLFLFIAKSIYYVYAYSFICSFGFSFFFSSSLTAAQQAFPSKRGLMSGVVNLIFGVAAAIMTPVLNALLNGPGYTFTNTLTIIFVLLCTFIAYALLWFSGSTKSENMTTANSPDDLSIKETLTTREFWTIWLQWTFIGSAGMSIVSLAKSYSISIGETGVIVLTAFNLANGVCRIFVGLLSDIIGIKLTGVIAYSLMLIGYICLPHIHRVSLVCLGVVGVGIGIGTLFTISPPLISKIFGLSNFGAIYGLIFTGYGTIGAFIGPALSGFILQKTNNNYLVVFTYLATMDFIGILLILTVQEKKKILTKGKSSKRYLIHKYDKDKIVNRKGLKAFHGRNYYCRNDNCISFENNDDHPPLIEFPDENGNIKKYILETCAYIKPETFWYCTYNHTYKETFYYLKCYNDSDCFYNKCIDNTCVYNGDSSVTHCDTIYKYFAIFEYSYIHCGKDYGEQCNESNECSSNICGADYIDDIKTCSSFIKEPSDNVQSVRDMQTAFIFVIIIGIFTLIFIMCCCYKSGKRKENKFKKIEK